MFKIPIDVNVAIRKSLLQINYMISTVLKIFKVPIQVNGAVAVHKLGWGL